MQLPTYDAKLACRVSGVPRPDISWFKDGQPITDTDGEKYREKREGDTLSLYVQDCNRQDSGVYKCVAKNKEGQDSCEAELEIVDKL